MTYPRESSIRPLRLDEAEEAAALKATRIRETFCQFGTPDQVEVEVANVAGASFMEDVARDPTVIFLVARSQGQLVGMGGIRFFEDQDPLVFSGFAKAGSGAGRRLLSARIEILATLGYDQVRAFVFALNALGRSHLRRAGFIHAGYAAAARSIPQVPVEEWSRRIGPTART